MYWEYDPVYPPSLTDKVLQQIQKVVLKVVIKCCLNMFALSNELNF